MSASVTYPVQVLREHIIGLEAAATQCLADPGGRPVHKLRTETRRVEALLLLLALVPGLPEHRKQAAHLLKTLARLRRAAGQVRDLDVHREMLSDLISAVTRPAATRGGRAPAAPNAPVLGEAAEQLRKRMGKQRNDAASDLQRVLQHRQGKMARAAEALLHALEPAETLVVPASDLLRDAEAVLTRDGLLRPAALAEIQEEDLHTLRKAAKAARYVAESLPGDPAVAAAASRFEALQGAGGEWHDALELARAARRRFGKTHELTALYRGQRDSKLASYRAALLAQARSAKPVKHARSGRPHAQ